MKKLLLIPAMLYPYALYFGFLFCSVFAEEYSSVPALAIFIVGFLLFPLACNVAFVVLSRKDDPRSLILSSLIVKIVHIPAYVIVFFFGLGASMMIFMTLPLIIMFVLFDCAVLLTSSFLSVFATAKNIKENKPLSIVALVCQFFFCADIISLFVLWFVSGKKRKEALV